jgi:hypothetical protein
MSHHAFLFHAVCYGAGLLGGAFLIVGTFRAPGRSAAHWMRVALWLAGSACMVWSALGVMALLGNSLLSPTALIVVKQAKTAVGGMGIGIIILLFASGEFVRAFSRSKPASSQ